MIIRENQEVLSKIVARDFDRRKKGEGQEGNTQRDVSADLLFLLK